MARLGRAVTGPRLEVAGAVLLVVAALVWSASIAIRMPLWSPLDEGAHYSVAHHLAGEGTLPAPASPPDVPADLPPWPPRDISLEAYQPPLDYLLLAGLERATTAVWPHVAGSSGINADTAAVRVERLSNAVCLAGIVLLLWRAARLLAPGNLVMAWAMPGALFLWRGPVLDATRVGNDILPALLATLAVYLALRWRERPSLPRMAIVGGVLGLGLLAKYTAAYAVIPIALLVLGSALGSRLRLRRAAAGVVLAGATAVSVVVPWLLVQHRVRGCFTCAAEQRADVPPSLVMPRPTPHVAVDLGVRNLHSLLDGQNGGAQIRPQHGLLDEALPWLLAALIVAGLVALLASRVGTGAPTRRPAAALALAAAAFPVFLVVLSVAAGTDFVETARYDLPAALPAALLVAAGPALLTPARGRRGVAALCLVGALALGANEVRLAAGPWPPGVGAAGSIASPLTPPSAAT